MAPERHKPSDQYVATQTVAIVAINAAASVAIAFLSRSSAVSPGRTPSAASHPRRRASNSRGANEGGRVVTTLLCPRPPRRTSGELARYRYHCRVTPGRLPVSQQARATTLASPDEARDAAA